VAGNAGAIRAGKAYVEIYADNSKLLSGLAGAASSIKAWGDTVATAGVTGLVATATAAFGASMAFMETGDALDKMSGRTGASVEFLSALSHAAKLGGTDIGAMEVSIKHLAKAAYEAQAGPTTAVASAFTALGVSVTDAQGRLKKTEDLFMETAAALSQVDNDTQKAALALEVFGRSGTEMLPMTSGKLDQLQTQVRARKGSALFPRAREADGVPAHDGLPCWVVRELGAGLIRVVKVERLGRSPAGVIEIAEGRELCRSQPLRQPPALAAVRGLDGALRFAVAVFVVEHRVLALVDEGA